MADFFNNLLYRLSKWNIITGLVLLFAGFFITLAASKLAGLITGKIEDEKERKEKESMAKLIFQIAGLVLSVLGFVFAMIIN